MAEKNGQRISFKVIVVGSSGIGKTSIIHRLVYDNFNHTQSTIGVEHFKYDTTVDETDITFALWDTAGQEKFYTIVRAYFRNAVAALLIFDITNRETFTNLPNWHRDIMQECNPKAFVILVGNKADLENERQVSSEEAEAFAVQHGLIYIETSAKTGQNIADAFRSIAHDLVTKYKSGEIVVDDEPESKDITSEEVVSNRSKCC